MQDETLNRTEDIASATECTGLVPALPANDSAADEELASLYAVLPPKKRNGRRLEGNNRLKP